MKLSIFILSIGFLFSTNNAQAQMTAFDKGAIDMLHKFYTSHIWFIVLGDTTENTRASVQTEDSLIRSNCTSKLYDSIMSQHESGSMDWDPFLDAQDAGLDWLKSLRISKNSNFLHGYIVRYYNDFSKKDIVIYLHVAMQSSKYLIDDILATANGKSQIF